MTDLRDRVEPRARSARGGRDAPDIAGSERVARDRTGSARTRLRGSSRSGSRLRAPSRDQRGLGLLEILIALAVVALAGYLLLRYAGSTTKAVEQFRKERPLASARLAADEATLATVQSQVRAYQAEKGGWPPDRTAVLGLLGGPPRFQCPGNDLDYDPTTGQVRLAITDASRC